MHNLSSITAIPGLYVHIPFCARLCHYCDFAKTSAFSQLAQQAYFAALTTQVQAWLAPLHEANKLKSVFFGGGTPGLFGREYAPILDLLQPRLATEAEVTLEVNPENVTAENCRIWRDIGFNRVSMGVQSFQNQGLVALTRGHRSDVAKDAAHILLQYFSQVNIDLIYGWHGQDQKLWRQDLQEAITLGIPHLSLYALTYEGQTPFARRVERGVWRDTDGDLLFDFYKDACDVLGGRGFEHEEVSNWSKPGHSCQHNWLYWSDQAYFGIGAGAHGYLPGPQPWGTRYAYGKNPTAFMQVTERAIAEFWQDRRQWPGELDERNHGSWMLERIAAGIRCRAGANVQQVAAERGTKWRPTPRLERALEDGLLHWQDGIISCSEAEWFREQAWALEIWQSLSIPDN